MSRHVPRKDRWVSHGPNEFHGEDGRVFFKAGRWHAELHYRLFDPETLLPGEPQAWIAGGFRRPRNAMIALEDRATELKRRHGPHIVFMACA
jgi:hypothetical protein